MGAYVPIKNFPFCGKILRFSVEVAEVSMKFDAIFEHDTRPASPETAKTLRTYAARCAGHVRCFCTRSLCVARVFCIEIAQFCDRKPRDFVLKFFKNQRASSRRRMHNA